MRDADFSGSCVTRSNKTQEGSILTYEKENDDSHIQRHGRTKAKLFEVIEKYKNMQGNMLPVLQGAQEIYGYLPIEVQTMIAEGLGVSLAEIYGVATFYSQFKLNPEGKVAIAVCLGTACYVKGSGQIADKITEIIGIAPGETSPDGKYSFEATRCIGACGLAPVLTINGEVYGRLTVADIAGILKKYE